MKTLITILTSCLLIQSVLAQTDTPYHGANSQNINFGMSQLDRFTSSIGQDKLLHLSGCYVIGASFNSLASRKYTRKQAFWIGFAAGTTVGIAKELYDIKHGNPEWGDLGADVIGSFLGSFTVAIRF